MRLQLVFFFKLLVRMEKKHVSLKNDVCGTP